MKVKELRIGNYFSYYGGASVGYLIGMHYSFTKNERLIMSIEGGGWCPHDINDVTPIPLTMDWLIKFGFENKEHSSVYTKGLNYGDDYKSDLQHSYSNHIMICRSGINAMAVKCDYVHQLQNLYFALTGEELNPVLP